MRFTWENELQLTQVLLLLFFYVNLTFMLTPLILLFFFYVLHFMFEFIFLESHRNIKNLLIIQHT